MCPEYCVTSLSRRTREVSGTWELVGIIRVLMILDMPGLDAFKPLLRKLRHYRPASRAAGRQLEHRSDTYARLCRAGVDRYVRVHSAQPGTLKGPQLFLVCPPTVFNSG